jgi:hypothetical protein
MKNTITLQTAQDWAERWKSTQESGSTPNFTAFLIPGIDFTQALKPEEAVDVRTYLGIDDTETVRLMIVGVDREGNDLIDESNGYYIYDFTSICPPYCNKKPPFISQ